MEKWRLTQELPRIKEASLDPLIEENFEFLFWLNVTWKWYIRSVSITSTGADHQGAIRLLSVHSCPQSLCALCTDSSFHIQDLNDKFMVFVLWWLWGEKKHFELSFMRPVAFTRHTKPHKNTCSCGHERPKQPPPLRACDVCTAHSLAGNAQGWNTHHER